MPRSAGRDIAKSADTVQLVLAELSHGPVGDVVARLQAAGRVRIITSADASGPAKRTQAWTEPDGRITINVDLVTPGEALAALLHEAFHAGGQKLLGTEQWQPLQKRLTGLLRQFKEPRGEARAFYDLARERVALSGDVMEIPDALAAEEFGTHTIEEYEAARRYCASG